LTIPTTTLGVAVIVAMVIPGIVFAAVRTALKGFQAHDRSVSARIVQAVMVSVVLDSVYLIFFGSLVSEIFAAGSSALLTNAPLVGWLTLLLGVAVPGAIAYCLYSKARVFAITQRRAARLLVRLFGRSFVVSRRRLTRVIAALSPNTSYNATPNSWEWIAPKKSENWIRVLSRDGRWVGSWSTQNTFFSSYPEPRDIFVPIQWKMGEDGNFIEPVENSSGVWIDLEGAQFVEWLDRGEGDD
jgi:hypothetical protein